MFQDVRLCGWGVCTLCPLLGRSRGQILIKVDTPAGRTPIVCSQRLGIMYFKGREVNV